MMKRFRREVAQQVLGVVIGVEVPLLPLAVLMAKLASWPIPPHPVTGPGGCQSSGRGHVPKVHVPKKKS
ncbi:MAG: hypothetical protein MZU79_07300 [Anaerotruncus sp.]|nr:hypothetical protein [Anaerotruncus sp.]